jgi:Holliday junction resolvasome RuvABC ATP-dependent DNA helicase subunit
MTQPSEPDAKAKVDAAFKGFIGNSESVHAIKRLLVYALANASAGEAATLAETILLVGPPSTGKSDLARRITACLDLPFVWLDGRGLRSRERLFDMIDTALLSANPPLSTMRNGARAGVPIDVYPSFIACVDEIHLVSTGVQEIFLTLLEADDRSLLLDIKGDRRVVDVARAGFIFATARPSELERAFRSRCTEIPLRRYTVEEVALMVTARFSMLPSQYISTIALCSRRTPRVAFAIASDFKKEIFLADGLTMKPCLDRVLTGRGILFQENGCTLDDVRYLRALRKARRPLGQRALRSMLNDIDPMKIVEDIEPYLFSLGYVVMSPGGREITSEGIWFLKRIPD